MSGWLYRLLFDTEPSHDCRAWLPSPLDFKVGTVKVCPECGEKRVKETYNDDDWYGGTGEFHTWSPLSVRRG